MPLILRYCTLVILISCLDFSALKAQTVDLVVNGVRSSRGEIVVAVFTDNKSFRNDQPVIRNRYPKAGLSEGVMHIRLSLSPGTYGLALLDDENSDDKLTTNLFGFPLEGYGFSNYNHSGFTKPDFDDFSFSLDRNQFLILNSKIKYIA